MRSKTEFLELANSELVTQLIDNNMGIMTCIMSAIKQFELSETQLRVFSEKTGKKGSELWDQFKARRNSPDTPDDYNFLTFVEEVLQDTDHAVTVSAD